MNKGEKLAALRGTPALPEAMAWRARHGPVTLVPADAAGEWRGVAAIECQLDRYLAQHHLDDRTCPERAQWRHQAGIDWRMRWSLVVSMPRVVGTYGERLATSPNAVPTAAQLAAKRELQEAARCFRPLGDHSPGEVYQVVVDVCGMDEPAGKGRLALLIHGLDALATHWQISAG